MSLEADGNIFRSVKTLDLRSVKETSADARRQLLEARRSAVQALASPTRPVSAAGGRVSLSASQPLRGSAQKTLTHSAAKAASTAAAIAAAGAAASAAGSAVVEEAVAAKAAAEAEAAEARAAADTAGARAAVLEDSLLRLVSLFGDHVDATSTTSSSAAGGMFYAVTFGPGAIGMILTTAEDGTVEVAELRTDSRGAPLLALACGKISVGDGVLAINDRMLARHGAPTLESVAAEFKAAPRPVRCLFFKKTPGAPLPRALLPPAAQQ